MDSKVIELDKFLELEAPSLVNWKNAPTVKDLKQDYQEAKYSHDQQVTKIKEWLDNLNVEGKAKVNAGKGNSSIVPKLIRKQAEWRYAALSEPFLSTDEVFNVCPVTWEDKQSAEQNQHILSHQFNSQIDKVRFIDEYVRTAVDEGTVIVRVGWDYEEEIVLKEEPVIDFRINPEMVQIHEQLAQLQQESPSQFDTDVPIEMQQAFMLTQQSGMPMEAVVVGYRQVEDVEVVKNQPTLEVCDYNNVIIDPTCGGDLDKANFVIYMFDSSLAELEKDGLYQNLEYINTDTNSILGMPDYSSDMGTKNFNFSDKPRKKFVVMEYWGYWDIEGDGVLKPIVASWVGDTLIRLEENPFPDKKIPFVMAQYLPVRKQIYGEPDGALLEDNQRIIGAVTRGMIDIMGKSANGQTGTQKGFLDPTNRRKFEKGLDYEYNPQVDPRMGVYMHTYPEIPQSAQFMLQLQNMEAESMTGVKSFSQGISQAALGNVATSVRGALDAASKRELGILRRLSNGIIQIGRKIMAMNAEFLSEEEVVRVTNEQFVTVRRDALQGDFDLRLSISTAEEDNNKAQELAFMLQTMGNNMDPSMSQMILADIAKLRKMPDLAKAIRDYQPQPDPYVEQRKQLELQLLEAQIQREMAMAQSHSAGAQLDVAKAGTEQVKAGDLQSTKDLKDLDFVEQESGVKQERNLQLQGEQARSQAQTKLLEHYLNKEKEAEKHERDVFIQGLKAATDIQKEKEKAKVKSIARPTKP